MNKTMNKGYKEVRIDNNAKAVDRSYHNPLTRVYQYEYALYTVVSGLFADVRCRSLCMKNLEAYFLELAVKGEDHDGEKKKSAKRTRDDLIAEVSRLVERDVVGKIKFPMINICEAEAAAIPEADGTHTFVFTDGIYGFSLRMKMPKKGQKAGIEVSDLHPAPGRKAAGEGIAA